MILENFVNLNNVGYLLTWQNFVSWGLFHYRLYHGTRVGGAGRTSFFRRAFIKFDTGLRVTLAD